MRAIWEGNSCLLSSGAPDSPVHTGQCPVPDFFPSTAKTTVGSQRAIGAPDMSGAHRIVRCPLQTVGPATRHARIARPTVGSAYCWLIGQSGAPPDSPVNFRRTPSFSSRERPVDQRQPGAPDTVRCTTGQSGAPRPSKVLTTQSRQFPFVFSLILALRQIC